MTLLAQSNSRSQSTDTRTDDQDPEACSGGGITVEFFNRHVACTLGV
jgi:hypothetical protein